MSVWNRHREVYFKPVLRSMPLSHSLFDACVGHAVKYSSEWELPAACDDKR